MSDAGSALLPTPFSYGGGQEDDPPLSAEGYLANLKADLSRRIEHLRAHKAHVDVEYRRVMGELEAQLSPLEATLAALNGEREAPPAPQPQKPKKPLTPQITLKRKGQSFIGARRSNGTATGFGVTVEEMAVAVAKVEALVAEDDAFGKGFFTQKDLYTGLGWDQSKGSQAVRYLHSIGYLRKAGFKNRRELWAIMEPDAYERVVADIARRQQERRDLLLKGPLDHEDRDVRAAAFIRKHKKVRGWKAVEEACEISDSVINTVRRTLLEEGLIRVSQPARGKPALIEWIGGRKSATS
jgi:hypothetical protein